MELKHFITIFFLSMHVSALKIPSHHKSGVYTVGKVGEVTRAKSRKEPGLRLKPSLLWLLSKGSFAFAPKGPARAASLSKPHKVSTKHARREADPWAFADPDPEAYAEAEAEAFPYAMAYPNAWAYPDAFAEPYADADPNAWFDDDIWGSLVARGGSGYTSDNTGCGEEKYRAGMYRL